MTISTGSFAKALLPGIHKWVGMEYKDYTPEYSAIFEKFTSTKAFEEEVGVTGFGYAAVKTEGNSITYDDMEQGFTQRYTHAVVALGFIITREMYKDNQYMEIGLRKTKGLVFSMKQTKEVIAANILNRAFDGDYLYADGLELCSLLHVNKSGGTWRNELTTAADISEASVEQACIDIGAFTNDRGMLIKILPKKLIIPPALEFDAARILKSIQQSGGANNDINALRTLSKIPDVVVNHYLTDSDAFFIKTDCPDGLKYFQREPLETATENDFDTFNARFRTSERYSFSATDPRGRLTNMPPYIAICNDKPCELRETPNVESRAILSEATYESFMDYVERATTIPQGSTLKRAEAQGIRQDDDMVSSAWRHAAV